jgi:hypothetical protein
MLLFPKATNCILMAGLLTYSLFSCLPILFGTVACSAKKQTEITAAGTVQDFHLFPYGLSLKGLAYYYGCKYIKISALQTLNFRKSFYF